MRENEEDWEKQLNTVILEITGINEIFMIDAVLLQVWWVVLSVGFLTPVITPVWPAPSALL